MQIFYQEWTSNPLLYGHLVYPPQVSMWDPSVRPVSDYSSVLQFLGEDYFHVQETLVFHAGETCVFADPYLECLSYQVNEVFYRLAAILYLVANHREDPL